MNNTTIKTKLKNNQSTNANTITPDNFNVKHITATDIKKSKSNGRTFLNSYLKYNGNRMFIETPFLKAPFGVSKYEKGNSGKFDYSLPMSAHGPDYENSQLKSEKKYNYGEVITEIIRWNVDGSIFY